MYVDFVVFNGSEYEFAIVSTFNGLIFCVGAVRGEINWKIDKIFRNISQKELIRGGGEFM